MLILKIFAGLCGKISWPFWVLNFLFSYWDLFSRNVGWLMPGVDLRSLAIHVELLFFRIPVLIVMVIPFFRVLGFILGIFILVLTWPFMLRSSGSCSVGSRGMRERLWKFLTERIAELHHITWVNFLSNSADLFLSSVRIVRIKIKFILLFYRGYSTAWPLILGSTLIISWIFIRLPYFSWRLLNRGLFPLR